MAEVAAPAGSSSLCIVGASHLGELLDFCLAPETGVVRTKFSRLFQDDIPPECRCLSATKEADGTVACTFERAGLEDVARCIQTHDAETEAGVDSPGDEAELNASAESHVKGVRRWSASSSTRSASFRRLLMSASHRSSSASTLLSGSGSNQSRRTIMSDQSSASCSKLSVGREADHHLLQPQQHGGGLPPFAPAASRTSPQLSFPVSPGHGGGGSNRSLDASSGVGVGGAFPLSGPAAGGGGGVSVSRGGSGRGFLAPAPEEGEGGGGDESAAVPQAWSDAAAGAAAWQQQQQQYGGPQPPLPSSPPPMSPRTASAPRLQHFRAVQQQQQQAAYAPYPRAASSIAHYAQAQAQQQAPLPQQYATSAGPPPLVHSGYGGGGGSFRGHPHAPHPGYEPQPQAGGPPPGADPLSSSLRVFVGKMSPASTPDSVKAYFLSFLERRGHPSPRDALLDVYMPVDSHGRVRGFAFVSFAERFTIDMLSREPAHIIDGRQVVLDVAAPRGYKIEQYVAVAGYQNAFSSPAAVGGPGPGGDGYGLPPATYPRGEPSYFAAPQQQQQPFFPQQPRHHHLQQQQHPQMQMQRPPPAGYRGPMPGMHQHTHYSAPPLPPVGGGGGYPQQQQQQQQAPPDFYRAPGGHAPPLYESEPPHPRVAFEPSLPHTAYPRRADSMPYPAPSQYGYATHVQQQQQPRYGGGGAADGGGLVDPHAPGFSSGAHAHAVAPAEHGGAAAASGELERLLAAWGDSAAAPDAAAAAAAAVEDLRRGGGGVGAADDGGGSAAAAAGGGAGGLAQRAQAAGMQGLSLEPAALAQALALMQLQQQQSQQRQWFLQHTQGGGADDARAPPPQHSAVPADASAGGGGGGGDGGGFSGGMYFLGGVGGGGAGPTPSSAAADAPLPTPVASVLYSALSTPATQHQQAAAPGGQQQQQHEAYVAHTGFDVGVAASSSSRLSMFHFSNGGLLPPTE